MDHTLDRQPKEMISSLPPHPLRSFVGWMVACVVLGACADRGANEEQVATGPLPENPAPQPLDGAPVGPSAESPVEPPPPLDIPEPWPHVLLFEGAEVMTEEVAQILRLLGQKVRVRDFEGVRSAFTETFQGHDLIGAPVITEHPLLLGARTREHETLAAEVLDRTGLLAGLEAQIGAWRRVDDCRFEVRDADFQANETPTWGKLSLSFHLAGVTAEGGRISYEGSAVGKVDQVSGGWRIDRWRIEHLQSTRSAAPLFSDVTLSTGVAFEGVAFGEAPNNSDRWNGAAAGDVDGDGLFDLFVPNSERNHLYRNRGDGTFAEEAQGRGLLQHPGGTGAVFFDFDNDGDQDLMVAHVGWEGLDGKPRGETLRLYANDGEGRFSDVTADLGLDVRRAAYSLSVLDYDCDGFLDVFVTGYGVMSMDENDSWLEASNGAPNSLFHNLGGERFVDVAEQAGVKDNRWSHASAVADPDGDGRPDIYVANNFGSNRLYHNQGDGTFEDVAPALGAASKGKSMGAAWGDLNGDGSLDLFVSNFSSNSGRRILERVETDLTTRVADDMLGLVAGNAVLLRDVENGTSGAYLDHGQASGAQNSGWPWGCLIADWNLDGALDVFCANGFVTGDIPIDT